MNSADAARVLVTSSRGWPDPGLLEDELEAAWHDAMEALGLRTLVVVHGACPTGGDPVADAWAAARRPYGVRPEAHPADWDRCGPDCPRDPAHRRVRRPDDVHHPGQGTTYCPGSGPRRNAHMVSLGAVLCLAAPHGRSTGTRGCMDLARRAGIPVRTLEARTNRGVRAA